MQFFKLTDDDVRLQPRKKKETTGIRLIEEPDKPKQLNNTKNSSDAYEVFSNLADESEFAEF